MKEFHKRSFVKAICWRALATFTTMAVVYIFTGEAVLSLGVGATEVLLKMLLYYLHERMWNGIRWGKMTHPLENLKVSRELEPEHLEEIKDRLEKLGYL